MNQENKMKLSITIEGCPFEDGDTLKTYIHAMDFLSSLHEVDNLLRARLKHGDIEDDEQIIFLERLRDIINETEGFE